MGEDGLSIEFYKATFHIIKHDLLDVLNKMLIEKFIPRKIKRGIIKLKFKEGDENDISNYRPITLLNLDYKILSKIIDLRLKPVLCEVLHQSQYAQQGCSIKDMNNLVRDILDDMEDQGSDSFMLQIDFCKAFDSISHRFLEKCFEKMGFHKEFIKMLMAFDENSTSKLLINGHLSKSVKLECGARQGDPLSLDKFIVVLNVLLMYIHADKLIVPFRSITNKEFLTAAFADDLYSFTNSIISLLHISRHVTKFKDASGLTVNMGKSKGLFFNNKNEVDIEMLYLTNITKWNQNLKILGVPYGEFSWELSFWKNKCKEVENDLKLYSDVGATMDAKAILSKTKVLPKFSYMASTKIVPNEIELKIDQMLLKFLVPHRKTLLKVRDFAPPRWKGGYDVDDVNLHASVFLISSTMRYVKNLVEGNTFGDHESFIEYNIGWQLCNYLKLPKNLSCPHRHKPNKIYEQILKIITENQIPAQLLTEGKIRNVYRFLVSKGFGNGKYPKYHRMHDRIFPNYLKSFDFRLHYNLLPVKRQFRDFALDNDSRCNFCVLHPETHSHIFSHCNKLQILWDFLDEVLSLINIDSNMYSFVETRKMYDYDMVNSRCSGADLKIVLYLNSIVNHNIWKYSRKIQYEKVEFDEVQLIKNVVKSMHGRKSYDNRLKTRSKLDNLEEACIAANFVKNTYVQNFGGSNNDQ